MVKTTPYEGISFNSAEKEANDSIFKDGLPSLNDIHYIKDDMDFKYPGYRMDVFSTIGDGYFIKYNNNLISPIREKRSLRREVEDKKEKMHLDGIFIVERFSLVPLNNTSCLDEVVRYLLNTSTVINNKDFSEYLKNKFIIGKRNKVKVKNNEEVVMRTVTYIPKDKIINNSLYIDKQNIIISDGIPDKGFHPKTLENHNIDGLNAVIIDLIDNEGRKEPYFIKVGEDVLPILPRESNTEVSGARLTTRVNGKEFKSKVSWLDNLEDIGIYDTKDKAVYNGNLDLKLNDEKMKSDLKKLELELEKKELDLKHQQDKINKEKEEFERKVIEEERKRKHEIDKILEEERINREKAFDEKLYQEEKRTRERRESEFKEKVERERLDREREEFKEKIRLEAEAEEDKRRKSRRKEFIENGLKITVGILGVAKIVATIVADSNKRR
jgi:hypothetical protein